MMVSLNTLAPVAIILGALNLILAAPAVELRAATASDATSLEARASKPKRGVPFNNPPTFIRKFNGAGSQVSDLVAKQRKHAN